MKPIAFGTLILNDERTWWGVLRDAYGLPRVTPQRAARYGAWPVMATLDRSGGRTLGLEVYWQALSAAQLKTARAALLAALNYERATAQRLLVADYALYGAAPDGLVAAWGPWEIVNPAGTYTARDLVHGVTLALSGGWLTDLDRLQLAPAAANYVKNPSAEDDSDNFAAYGSATVTVSATYAYRGPHAYKIETTGVGDGIRLRMLELEDEVQVSFWARGTYTTLQVGFLDLFWTDAVAVETVGAWTRYLATAVNTEGPAENLYIRQSDATARTIYLDAVQVELSATVTPYLDGDQGAGHSWDSTAHGSDSARTAAVATLAGADLAGVRALEFWWTPVTLDADGYLFRDGDLALFYNHSDAVFVLSHTDGLVNSATVALTVGVPVHVVALWDETTLTLVVNGDASSDSGGYGDLGATVYIGSVDGSSGLLDGYLVSLRAYTALTTTQAAQLYAAGATWNPRYLDAWCTGSQPASVNGQPVLTGEAVSLAVDGDVRWRQPAGIAWWWLYAATGSCVVDNAGDDDAYPVFRLTPRTAKTSGFRYRRWVGVAWQLADLVTRYPVLIAAALNLTSKAQADGDDIRVYVDGIEVDRWLGGTLVSSVNVWANLDFQANVSLTLQTALADSGDLTAIVVNESIDDLPVSGILQIDTEVFTYTGKNNRTRTFSGIARATRGTTAAAHTATTAVAWIQHDIWIYYGDSTLSAPVTDDDYQPLLDLGSSTNTSWVYDQFGDDAGLRPYSWVFERYGNAYQTTANHGGSADPWTEIGIHVAGYILYYGRIALTHPCGITAANFTNGEKYATDKTQFTAEIQSWSGDQADPWVTEYSIAAPLNNSTWESWSRSETLTGSCAAVALYLLIDDTSDGYLEAADCTITLDSDHTPAVTTGAEQSNYALAVTLANTTTGESLTLTVNLTLDETLTLDTAAKTLTLADGTGVLFAKTLNTVRQDWLRLVPGENTLTYADTGTVKVEIEITYERRYFA